MAVWVVRKSSPLKALVMAVPILAIPVEMSPILVMTPELPVHLMPSAVVPLNLELNLLDDVTEDETDRAGRHGH